MSEKIERINRQSGSAKERIQAKKQMRREMIKRTDLYHNQLSNGKTKGEGNNND